MEARLRADGRARAILLVLVLATLGGAPLGAGGGDRFAGLGDEIRLALEETGVPSVAVGVARNGRVLWEGAFGLADRERGVPATPHTPYAIASVTKPFTATALMILVERGRIALDRPINDYLGDARLRARVGDVERATVRRVAGHTAGLPLHFNFIPRGSEPGRPPMAETLRRYGNLVTPPGERFDYSNLGYGVLEVAIERASGEGFGAFLRREVFEPLALTHTWLHVDPAAEGEVAVRYGTGGEPLSFYDFDHRGASAIAACVDDLLRFGVFHLAGADGGTERAPILSRRARRAMQRPGGRGRDAHGYGLGWTLERRADGRRAVLHTGGMPGVTASLTLIPAEGLAVAALANTQTELPLWATERILEILLDDRPPGNPSHATANGPSPRRSRLPRGLNGVWQGAIETPSGAVALRLEIRPPGRLEVSLEQGPARPVRPLGLDDGSLLLRIDGELPPLEADPPADFLLVSLTRRGRRLTGSATEIRLPGAALPAALSHWVELTRGGSPPDGG